MTVFIGFAVCALMTAVNIAFYAADTTNVLNLGSALFTACMAVWCLAIALRS